jgi:hypothetical protein
VESLDRVAARLLGRALVLAIACACTDCSSRKAPRVDAGGAPPAPPAGGLPDDPERMLDDLLADDLVLRAAKDINGTVVRLDLERGGRRFRAKWKPLGPEGSEEQDGFDGNNSPRCEVAAWRANRMLFGRTSTARHLVPPVVVRAVHRDVPCDRACAHLPRLAAPDAKPTFPALNDHLVLGALSFWIDGVTSPARFQGGLWDRARFDSSAEYRRSFSDLCMFLTLIAHGDANYADNFLAREPALDRLYSIDNGRAFDGVPFYSERADPDWDPFRRLSPERLVAPAFSRQTVGRLDELTEDALGRELRVVAAIDMATGAAARDQAALVGQLADRPLDRVPELKKRGRGLYLGKVNGATWVILGIGEPGIDDTAARARAIAAHARPLFDR